MEGEKFSNPPVAAEKREEKKMKIVCGWCKKFMGYKEGGSGETTSICKECKKEHFPSLEKKEDNC